MSWLGSPGADREARIGGCLGDLGSISSGGGGEPRRRRRAVKSMWSRKLPPWELSVDNTPLTYPLLNNPSLVEGPS